MRAEPDSGPTDTDPLLAYDVVALLRVVARTEEEAAERAWAFAGTVHGSHVAVAAIVRVES